MCTVTYLPKQDGYFLTSNRDEKSTRKKAILPKIYNSNNQKFIFPKDADAGGTWIVLKENNDALCLLNGAFENFEDKGNYTISRGKILLDIAGNENMLATFNKIDLKTTAPFTLIMIQEQSLVECRWDGEKKHIKKLESNQAYIWSSATLYDKNMQVKREMWFEKFLAEKINFMQDDVISFHKNTGEEDIENDLVMNRNNQLFTVSVTSISVKENDAHMYYNDIINNDSTTARFEYEQQLS
jgi:Transport and Golgi organisation 2